MKNILFYYIKEIVPNSGGVERVVSMQYQKLSERGYNIFTIYGLKNNNDSDIEPILGQYQLPVPNNLSSKENIQFIKNFILQNNICIVLNFAALFNKGSICIIEACKVTKVPVISVIHNTQEYLLWKLPFLKNIMKYNFVRNKSHSVLKLIHSFPLYKGGLYIYKNTAATVVLSPCYIDEYKSIIKKKATNIYSIYNPSPIQPIEEIDWKKKEQMVLFVGRLEKQKSVEKLIHIWAKLNVSGWKLCIVGSGSQEQYLKELALKLNVSDRITFEGQQPSLTYYRKAKILCLTSIYEGYPMTVIECQSCGVVPVIYASFTASYDMITSGKDGIVIPAFDEEKYIMELRRLMNNDDNLKQMSYNCVKTAKRYSINSIIDKWVEIIENYSKKV